MAKSTLRLLSEGSRRRFNVASILKKFFFNLFNSDETR